MCVKLGLHCTGTKTGTKPTAVTAKGGAWSVCVCVCVCRGGPNWQQLICVQYVLLQNTLHQVQWGVKNTN